MVNMSIQSRTALSSLSVLGEKLSSSRTFASYFGGSSIPDSRSSYSAARKKSRVRSSRPRVAISTAADTRSGRASISSWAMNDPIDTATMRTGPGVELLDERRGVADHLLGGEALRVLGGADAAVVERDDAVAGPLEGGYLVQVPGPARSPAAGDEQDGLPRAAVVVGQIHPADPTWSRFRRA